MGRRSARDEGSSAIELAILAPAMLLVIFVMIQAGLWEYGRNVALDAAQHGVSRLRVLPANQVAAQCPVIETAVADYAKSIGSSGLVTPVAAADYAGVVGGGCLPAGTGLQVHVTVTGHAVSLVPGLDLTISRTATGEIEQFQNDN